LNKALKFILPPLVLVVAAAVVGILIKTKPPVERKEIEKVAPLAVVKEATRQQERLTIEGVGSVMPAQSVSLRPEVQGKIIRQSDQLMPGGRLKKGQFIAQIDPRDYELALEQAKEGLARAELALTLEKARKVAAEKELQIGGANAVPSAEGRAIALREPHVKQAEAAVASANSMVKKAELALARTTLTAPFNALVLDEFIDVGQVVSPQMGVANLVGSDAFWVKAKIAVEELRNVKLPDEKGQGGAEVQVVQDLGGTAAISRVGVVKRVLSQLDPLGQMAQVLVEITNPLKKEEEEEPTLPLLPGARVRVVIDAGEIEDVYVVPRSALQEGETVFLATADNRLQRRKVEIARRRVDDVLVRTGLSDGDRLVVSRLPAPVEGMELRVQVQKQAPPPGRAEGPHPQGAGAKEDKAVVSP
jgi:RND family efflux transporter MFP subunit